MVTTERIDRRGRRRMDLHTAAARRALYRHLGRRPPRPGRGTALSTLRARTWTHPVSDMRPLLRAPYAIIGGVATRLYTQERASADLDILVRPDDFTGVEGDLARAGATRLGDHPAGGGRWRLLDGTALDVLAPVAPWVDAALAHPRRAPGGQPVVDLPYLVTMKLLSCKGHDWGDLARLVGDLDDGALVAVRKIVARYVPDAVDDLEWLVARGRLEFVDVRE